MSEYNHLFKCVSVCLVTSENICILTLKPHVNLKTLDNEDITNQFSPLITDDLYFSYFDNFIEAYLSYLSVTSTTANAEIYSLKILLIQDSLYVNQLIRLSLSIPNEIFIKKDSDYFYNYYCLRAHNSTINQTLGNISVFISNVDTNVGRSDFAQYYTLFDSVDVILTTIHSNMSFSNLTNSRLSASIVSNISNNDDFEPYPLNNNISIKFENNHRNNLYDNSSYSLSCVWYDTMDYTWSDTGCVTIVDSNDNVNCHCNHLTTFAVLHEIDQYETGGNNNTDKKSSSNFLDALTNPIYLIIILILIGGFVGICIFVIRLFWKLIKNNIKAFQRGNEYETAHGALFFTLVQSIVQINACATLYLFSVLSTDASDNFSDSSMIVDYFGEFLTLSLLVPPIIYFYIFSHVIYGMAIVAQSLSSRMNRQKQKLRRMLIISNVLVTLIFLLIAAVLLLDLNRYFFNDLIDLLSVFEALYIVLMLFPITFVFYFSVRAIGVVWHSIKRIRDLNSKQKNHTRNFDFNRTASLSSSRIPSSSPSHHHVDETPHIKALWRIVGAATCTCLFILIQIGFTVYFAIFPYHLSPIVRLIDIFWNWLFLVEIVFLYQHYIKNKIRQKKSAGTLNLRS